MNIEESSIKIAQTSCFHLRKEGGNFITLNYFKNVTYFSYTHQDLPICWNKMNITDVPRT